MHNYLKYSRKFHLRTYFIEFLNSINVCTVPRMPNIKWRQAILNKKYVFKNKHQQLLQQTLPLIKIKSHTYRSLAC